MTTLSGGVFVHPQFCFLFVWLYFGCRGNLELSAGNLCAFLALYLTNNQLLCSDVIHILFST